MARKFTGERLEPHIFNGNSIKHLHRYAFVTKYIKNKTILDIACGEGYGSHLMSNFASFVYGVDIDKSAIEDAKVKYKNSNLKFFEGSTSDIPVDDNSIDVVISFETLEHHDEHDKMFNEVKRVLRQDGILIISTPDKFFYSDLRKYKNPFHVKELYKSDFIALINRFFVHSQILSQSYLNGNSVLFDEATNESVKYYTGDFSELTETVAHPEFLIAIASDVHFIKEQNTIFDGSKILKDKIADAVKDVYNSATYKVGKIILFPYKFLKRKMHRKKPRI